FYRKVKMTYLKSMKIEDSTVDTQKVAIDAFGRLSVEINNDNSVPVATELSNVIFSEDNLTQPTQGISVGGKEITSSGEYFPIPLKDGGEAVLIEGLVSQG